MKGTGIRLNDLNSVIKVCNVNDGFYNITIETENPEAPFSGTFLRRVAITSVDFHDLNDVVPLAKHLIYFIINRLLPM
jgi:hypothetical protein